MSMFRSKEILISNLKEIEMNNIKQRIHSFVDVINQEVSKQLQNAPSFEPTIDESLYVGFIDKFGGIHDKNECQTVFTMDRAKSWLNSKRAMNFSKTLFPVFLTLIEQYADVLSTWQEPVYEKTRFALNWMWRFSFLYVILKADYVPDSFFSPGRPLICQNSLKYKSNNIFKNKLESWGLNVESCSIEELARQSQDKAKVYHGKYSKLKQEQCSAMCNQSVQNCFIDFRTFPSTITQQFIGKETQTTLHVQNMCNRAHSSPCVNIDDDDCMRLQQRYVELRKMNVMLKSRINELRKELACEYTINKELKKTFQQNVLIKKYLAESHFPVPFNFVNLPPPLRAVKPTPEDFMLPQDDVTGADMQQDLSEFMSMDENDCLLSGGDLDYLDHNL